MLHSFNVTQMAVPHIREVVQQLYDLRPIVVVGRPDVDVAHAVFLLSFGVLFFELVVMGHFKVFVFLWLIMYGVEMLTRSSISPSWLHCGLIFRSHLHYCLEWLLRVVPIAVLFRAK